MFEAGGYAVETLHDLAIGSILLPVLNSRMNVAMDPYRGSETLVLLLVTMRNKFTQSVQICLLISCDTFSNACLLVIAHVPLALSSE